MQVNRWKRYGWLFWLLIAGGIPAAEAQNQALTGFCVKGATAAVTSGFSSFNTLQGVVPGGPAGCLVQVYLTGTTTAATIYSSTGGGALANPFRAALSGQWIFYAATGVGYDVVLSGGIAPNTYASPVTLTDLMAGGGGGSGGAVLLAPAGAQAVVQPAGTALSVNLLNGTVNSESYNTGNNGIANSIASTNCSTAGCRTATPQTSVSAEIPTAYTGTTMILPGPFHTHSVDMRWGTDVEMFQTPIDAMADAGYTVNWAVARKDFVSFGRRVANQPYPNYGYVYSNTIFPTGGNNFFNVSGPEFKSNYQLVNYFATFNTPGQHGAGGTAINCFSIGDCQFSKSGVGIVTASFGDAADEGAHPVSMKAGEPTTVMTSTCTVGCTTGSTLISISGTQQNAPIGDEGYIEDWIAPIYSSTAGCHIASSTEQATPMSSVTLAGTSCAPASIMMQSAAAYYCPSNHPAGACGAQTVAIATSGVTSGFAVNTSGLPGSGVACVNDTQAGVATPVAGAFEEDTYTVVDSTHISLTFSKPHVTPPVVSVGGWCGYHFIPTANISNTTGTGPGTAAGIPASGNVGQSLTIAGAIGNTIYLADYAQVAPVYASGTGPFGTSESRVYYSSLSISSISRTSNVTTVVLASNTFMNQLRVTVAGVADSSYNGTFTFTGTGSTNTFTYPNTGANGSSSGGTATADYAEYTVVPALKIKQVMNPTTLAVDLSNIALYPNNVGVGLGDPLVIPHGSNVKVQGSGGFDVLTQVQPRNDYFGVGGVGQGIQYAGLNGPSLYGYTVGNNTAIGNYYNFGGTMLTPASAYTSAGLWNNGLIMETAPVTSVVQIGAGAGGNNSASYNLFSMADVSGTNDTFLNYSTGTGGANPVLGFTSLSHYATMFATYMHANLDTQANRYACANTNQFCLGYVGNGFYSGILNPAGTLQDLVANNLRIPSDKSISFLQQAASTSPNFTLLSQAEITSTGQNIFNFGSLEMGGTTTSGILNAATFAAGTSITVAGQNVCQANGTNCPAPTNPIGGSLTTANVALGAGAGSSPTGLTVTGFDGTHQIAFTTGTSPTANATLFTVTFTATRGHVTACVAQLSGGAAYGTITLPAIPTVSGVPSATVYTMTSGTTALGPSTTYQFNVVCP